MKTIEIKSKDEVYVVKVDAEDYGLLMRHKWFILHSGQRQRPYAFTRLYTGDDKKNGRTFLMHHMIMGTSCTIDHINTDSLDNRKENLRPATRQQNSANARKQIRKGKPCTSKYKGVTFAQGKFRAVIRCDGKTYQLGSYMNEDEAGMAYNVKAQELFGEYAHINQISLNGLM